MHRKGLGKSSPAGLIKQIRPMAFPLALPLAFRTACLKGHRPLTDEAHHIASLRAIAPPKWHPPLP